MICECSKYNLWMRLEMCVSYAYHTNEMARRVWFWKEITLCAHHMNRVSRIVGIECQEVMFMKKESLYA